MELRGRGNRQNFYILGTMPIHTELPPPSEIGEHKLARRLEGMNAPGLHLWFNVSWLPGVGEIDIVTWRAQGGFLPVKLSQCP